MRKSQSFGPSRLYIALALVVGMLFCSSSAKAQCYEDFYVYQVYPYGQLCSPQPVTLQAEYYSDGSYVSGEFRWYTSETDPMPVHTDYVYSDYGNMISNYNVYATNGLTIWVSFFNYNTWCESYRMPYTFYIASPAYVYQDYGSKCGYDVAKVQVSSNASGVSFELYKLVEYYDPYYGWTQQYEYQQGNSSGYFEIYDFYPEDQYNYYVKMYQPYGCSTPYYYQLYFELTGPEPPTVTGNLSITSGSSTTLNASGNAYTFRWYDANGNQLFEGWQYTTPNTLIPNTYTYQVRGVSSDGACLTDPTSVTLTVNYPTVSYTSLFNSSNFTKTIDLSKPVGTINGVAGATPSGGVTYSIPIQVSPGTNNLQPNVSVTYSSQAGNGVAGFGWNITGLSVISRTGKNIYHNGIVKPVSYTNEDAFLLDGMRLNAISGTNGANGTIYAGEVESFAKIISFTTSSANNPDWFKVIAKDGSILEFGHTIDSRILTDDGQNVMLWRLNRILDVNGNYIDLVYENNFRDSRIKMVKYTGNAAAAIEPYNSVTFDYKVRTDKTTGYEGGASLSSAHLLDKITVKADNSVFRTYQFNYGFDNISSLLKEVVETGSNGSSLNSTIFLYGDQPQIPLQVQSTSALIGSYDFYAGDFNADGKTDLLAASLYYNDWVKYYSRYELRTDLYSPNPFYTKGLTPQGNTAGDMLRNVFEKDKHYNFLTADYNGDGRDDILTMNTSLTTISSTEKPLKINSLTINYTNNTSYTSSNFTYPTGGYMYSKKGNFLIPGDFDGDGNQDYILFLSAYPTYVHPNYAYHHKAFLTNPSKGETNQEILDFGIPRPNIRYSLNPENVATSDKIVPADFDGDGKTDILVVRDQEAYILVIDGISAASGYSYQSSIRGPIAGINKDSKLFVGDFNGDRKTDLLVRNGNGTWKVMYSTGTSFVSASFVFNQTPNLTGAYSDDKLIISDFNGDGKSDILHGFPVWVNGVSNSSKFSVYYGKGESGASFYHEQYSYNNVLAFGEFTVGDFNGDGRSDLLNRPNVSSAADIISIKPFGQERLLQKATDGHNTTTTFQYKLLTDKSTSPYVYERTVSLDNAANQNPYNYVQFPFYALSSMIVPNGNGGTHTTTFTYQDAVMHRAARGFLGFKKIVSKNLTTGISSITENEINTQYAVPYTTKQTSSLILTGAIISQSQITTSFVDLSTGFFDKRFLQKVDKVLNIDNVSGAATESVNTFDSYGNITTNVTKAGSLSGTSVNPIETVTTTTSFGSYNTPVPALPDNITVSNQRTGVAAQGSTTQFTYTPNGLVASKTDFQGLPKAVTTSFTYNGTGNVTSIVTSSSGLGSRTTSFTYDTRGRFATTKQISGSGVSQSQSFNYDAATGKLLSQTSSDCLTTTYEYDGFGRLKKTTLPAGYSITSSLNWDVQNGNVYYALTDYPGGSPDVKAWFDVLGRPTKKQTAGFNNQWLTQLTTYDAKGNVATTTNEYYSTETPITTTHTYDTYNRLITSANSLSTASYEYVNMGNGNLQMVTTIGGQNTSKIADATGKVVTVIDNGGQLDFTYDSWGNQTEVKHGSTVLVTSTYDSYGRQTGLTDKNAGTVTYEYDAFGQLKKQTDNNGNIYNMAYDDLGRIISRQGPEGPTTYEYYKDPATGCSNNSLSKVSGFNGIVKEYTYSNLKRLESEKVTVDGTTYTTQFSHDTYGNLTNTTYPSGVVVNNGYDANGGLLTVTGGNAASPTTIFTAGEVNGLGHYTNYTLGNGKTSQLTFTSGFPTRYFTTGVQDLNLSFDYAKGNLLSRNDAINNITETFSYDNLNRLTTTSVNGSQQLSITYDGNTSHSMGNIVSKSDMGNYVYKTDKIHAIAYITNPVGPQAPPAIYPTTPQVITYTPFLKAASITEDPYQLDFTYGPDYQRIKTVLKQSGSVSETRYFHGNYERQTNGGSTREIHYVSGGNGLCAMIVRENGVNNFYFTYADHLGSIVAVTDISGNIVAQQNFDAWGRKRNPTTWGYSNVPTSPVWLYRGYTGHEHLPQFTLINMNGRLYDPIQASMLSPDNFVPTPFGTQGYNRYAYALNNPLVATDPDGDFIHILIGAAIGGTINLLVKAAQGKIGSFSDGLKAFGVGAVAGGAAAATGGAALAYTGLSGAGVFGGAVAGFTGSAAASPILGAGNGIFFGDPYSIQQFGTDLVIGTVTGGIIGGVTAGIKGNTILTDRTLEPGESIWSFRSANKVASGRSGSVYVEPMVDEQYLDDAGNVIENFGQNKTVSTQAQGLRTPSYPEYPGFYSDDISSLQPTHPLTVSRNKFQGLVDNIKINGIREPIKYVEVNGAKYIVNGHHRYFAAKGLGIMRVPVERVTLPYGGYNTIQDLMFTGKMPGYYKYIKW